MRFKRPKTVYHYDHKRLEKHKLTEDCLIEVVEESSEWTRLRCRSSGHDIYGFAMQKEAKRFEIQQTKQRIFWEQEWLEKLEREK